MTLAPIVIRGKTFTPEKGQHEPDGHACVMEMAAYLAHEPWSDHPACASPVIGAFARAFWDGSPDNWPGLIERLPRIAGSANRAADAARSWLATDWPQRRPKQLIRVALLLYSYNAARKVMDAAFAETVVELRASEFGLLDAMLDEGAAA